jgi:NADH-quinone oxidoreductase subunit A
MQSAFGSILLFVIAGIVLLSLVFFASKKIRPNKPTPEKLTTYESGEEPVGQAIVQFNMRFFVIALVFVLFEVEILFLFPWATVFGNKQLQEHSQGAWGTLGLIEMFIFIGLLGLGLAFAWAYGMLDWQKPIAQTPPTQNKIPKEAYKRYLE